MEEKALNIIPKRIKYYLLEWKNDNIHTYINKYGELSLRQLTMEQLYALFDYATNFDTALLRTLK